MLKETIMNCTYNLNKNEIVLRQEAIIKTLDNRTVTYENNIVSIEF